METADFAVRWNDYLLRNQVETKFKLFRLPAPDSRLSEATSRFLCEMGMPDAAGCQFDLLPEGLKKIVEVYGQADDWNDSDRERLEPFLMLGSDQGGNPLCLDLANHERIVFLDHESNFEVRDFVNSSVSQLAECILLFQEMVEKYQNEHGEDAELYEGNVPEVLVEQTLNSIGSIDPMAVGEHCYWPVAMDFI